MSILGEVEGVQFRLFEMDALDDMASVVAEAFTRDEPTSVTLNIQFNEFADWVKLFGPTAAREQLTLIARDSRTNEPVGSIIAGDFASPPPEGRDELIKELRPILALLDELDAQYKAARSIPPGEYLHLAMFGVRPHRHGEQIGQRLVRFCLENAITKGYKTAVAEATGQISQHILAQKFGFTACHEASYKDFTYEGRRVFKSIRRPTGVVLMEKPLV